MFQCSDGSKAIDPSLTNFQGGMKAVGFDSENPHFRNKYASWAAVREAVRSPLAENSLNFKQRIEERETGVFRLWMVTRISHSSGEWFESDYPINVQPGSNMQAIQSAATYARRGGLCLALGIAADYDDDGHEASQGIGGAYRVNAVEPGKTSSVPTYKAPVTRASPENMGMNLPVSFLKEHAELLDWILPIGEGVKGKKLRDIPLERLKGGFEQLSALKDLGKIEEVTRDQIGKLLKLIADIK